jgi:hypothetical protein
VGLQGKFRVPPVSGIAGKHVAKFWLLYPHYQLVHHSHHSFSFFCGGGKGRATWNEYYVGVDLIGMAESDNRVAPGARVHSFLDFTLSIFDI